MGWATLRGCCSERARTEKDDTRIADFSIFGGGGFGDCWRGFGVGLVGGARRPLARLDGSVAIGGLKDGVIVDRDRWGRPWIRAKSLQDVVTAQGYLMAQARLWQMVLLGRGGGGRFV